MKSLGFAPFIDRANGKILDAVSDYQFKRKLGTDPEKALQDANEKVFEALKERDFFIDLSDRLDNDCDE